MRAVGAEMLVGRVGHVAFFAFQHDGDDLLGEVARFGRALGAVVAFYGQRVLRFAGDAPLGGDVFSGHAHVDGVEGVVQRADHHVDHLGVAHASAPAGVERCVGATAHVFGAAANGDIGVTQQNRLAGRNDGLQAGAAQAVDVERGRALGTAAVDGRDARQIHVFRLGVDHMAKHHMADVRAVHVGAFEGFAHDLRGQLGRGNVFQTTAKGTDGGARTADNYNFTTHDCLLNRWLNTSATMIILLIADFDLTGKHTNDCPKWDALNLHNDGKLRLQAIL